MHNSHEDDKTCSVGWI